MNRDRIVEALNSDFRQLWLNEVPVQGERTIDLAAMLLRLAEGSAPTVEALIRETVRDALTEVATLVRVATDGMNLHDDWPDGMLHAADMLDDYRDEHYPEGES